MTATLATNKKSWWKILIPSSATSVAATIPRLLFSGRSGWLYLSWIRWLPCTQRPWWSNSALQIQCTWKSLENYYKHLSFTNQTNANNAQQSEQNLGHLLCPVFKVRKSKNLETSIGVLFFFFCFLTREISSESQIKNNFFEIEEFLEALFFYCWNFDNLRSKF
jgi:hypothetical protein